MADDLSLFGGASAAAERYPWHEPLWRQIVRQLDRLPHALLFHGQPGLGKHTFALQLAQALLCSHSRNCVACGQCQDCRLFAAGTHPDLSVIGPLEDSKVIAVDQIRALGEFLSLRPHTAARKIVIISPAEAMNLNAANSLLKLLEEPPLGSILILVTSHPARLPATIRSRCRRILFKSPARSAGIEWLRSRTGAGGLATDLLGLAGGAPLLAEELAGEGFAEERMKLLRDLEALSQGREDPVSCAARWKAAGAGRCLGWLYGFVADLIKGQMGAQRMELLNPETLSLSEKNKYKIIELYKLVDVIYDKYRQLGSPLDELLMLEDVLIRWVRLGRLQ